MAEIEIRTARPADSEAVVELRWRWVAERDGLPAVGRDEFVRRFAAWARENAATHRCLVLVCEDRVIGMAFLAITARVPTLAAFSRDSGDMQCVYVVPEARDAGFGGLLIDSLNALRSAALPSSEGFRSLRQYVARQSARTATRVATPGRG